MTGTRVSRLKSAALAWIVLNLFLIPALADWHSVDNTYQSLHSIETEKGAFGRVTPLQASEPITLRETVSTVALVGRSPTLSFVIYALVAMGFWAIVILGPKDLLKGYALPKSVLAIGLMFALPIFSSRVMGGINDVTMYGEEDGIPDYFRSIGVMVISLNVTIPGDNNISKDQIAVQLGSETLYFSECGLSNETNLCEMSEDNETALCGCVNILGTNSDPLGNGKYNMRFLAFTDLNPYSTFDTHMQTIWVDAAAPRITMSGEEQIQDKLQVDISVRDPVTGYIAGEEYCGGVDRIEFYRDGTLLSAETITLEQEPGNCTTYVETINLTMSTSGNSTIWATAYDNLGNAANSSNVSIFIDVDPPVVDSSFKVFQGGQHILYMSTVGPTAGLRGTVIEVIVDDHNLSYILANMSTLSDNIIYQDRYKSLNLVADQYCEKTDDHYVCRFSKAHTGGDPSDIFIHVPEAQLSFSLTAVDSIGLETTLTVTTTMIVDNDRAVVTKLGTFSCNENNCYIRKGANSFLAEITEDASGFDFSLVWVNLQSVTGSADVKQMWCQNEGGATWLCLTQGTTVGTKTNGQGYRISLSPQSMDDAGNPLGGETQSLVIYDDIPPTVDEDGSSVLTLKTDGTLAEYHESADTLVITLKGYDAHSGVVKDDGTWDVSVDMTDVLPDENISYVQADQCDQVGGNFTCRWEHLGPIVDGPFTKAEGLNVHIRDVAGNVNDSFAFKPFVIYAPTNSSPGDVWSHSDIDCMPGVVDRSIIRYYPNGNKLWCEFKLSASTQYVALSISQLGECVPLDNDTKDYFSKSQLFGDQMVTATGAKDPVLYSILHFDAQTIDPAVTELNMYCMYNILFADNRSKRLFLPEIENVTITVPVVNGVAALDSALHDQVDELKDNLKGSAWIDDVSDIVDTLKNVCTIINSLVGIVDGVTLIIAAEDWIPFWNVKMTLGVAADAMNRGKDTAWEIMTIACYVLECKINPISFFDDDSGYVEFIQGVIEVQSGDVGGQFLEDMSTSFSNSNPEDSLIMSILMLCIPGVLYNLNQARQIDCFYVLCMEKMVPLGWTVYSCKSSRYLLYCQFVIGQIFALIPFVQMLKNFGALIDQIFSDPMALIGFALGVACGVTWVTGFLGLGGVCEVPLALAQITSSVGGLTSTIKNWDSDDDYCDEALA